MKDVLPDLIVHNARLTHIGFDRDEYPAPTSSFAVRRGRIIARGGEELRDTGDSRTRRIDAGGRLVLPGFFDSHNHFLKTALGQTLPQLSGAASVAGVMEVIARAAAASPDGWVQTSPRWHESSLQENRFPTIDELDAAAMAHPVLIKRGGHNVVINSRAMRLLGISEDTTNPPGGTLVRDETGRLTGHIIGAPYINTLLARIPEPSDSAKRDALEAMGHEYARHGITSVIEPGLLPHDIALLQSEETRARVAVRTHLMWRVAYAGESTQSVVDDIAARIVSRVDGEDTSVFGIKMSVDGGVETGFYRDDYTLTDDPSSPRGKSLLSPEALFEISLQAARSGWHVGVHCVGDAAIDMALDAFEQVDSIIPLRDRRWSLIHAMYPRDDQWSRIRELSLTVTAQQPLFWALAAGFERYLGPARAQLMNPLATILREMTLPVGGGSDSPVAPFAPLAGISSSLSREVAGGFVFGREQGISARQAVAMYTEGSAYCAFQEERVGALTTGRLADFTILSHDFLSAPEAVEDTQVLYTARSGEATFDAL